ncbi:hypothetical protein FOMPIDRAFT_50388, partial [Fomitopsis schrenkii]
MGPDTLQVQPVLPPELCDIIFDHLRDDPQILAVCALVCRSWVPHSRSRQFHTLVLHHLSTQRQKLSLISDPSSTILSHVRHLVL